jgi:hypothetical protein
VRLTRALMIRSSVDSLYWAKARKKSRVSAAHPGPVHPSVGGVGTLGRRPSGRRGRDGAGEKRRCRRLEDPSPPASSHPAPTPRVE